MSKLTLQTGINLCRGFEMKLIEIGYHCGLTGSILHKGESEKDIDIIIYPHDINKQIPINKIIEHIGVETDMYKTQGESALAKNIVPSTTDKCVVVGEINNIRIDLFFLQ